MVFDVVIEGTFVIKTKVEASSTKNALADALDKTEKELKDGFYVDSVSIDRSEG